jgi:hypothetical protein
MVVLALACVPAVALVWAERSLAGSSPLAYFGRD